MGARRICIVTATRAEYGLLAPLLREIRTRDDLQSQLVVTGTHLSTAYGMTVEAIEADGHEITRRVDILAPGDDAGAAARTMAATVEKMTAVFEELKPDILVLLGDRYETLGAASAALLAGTPIAHIHGGELTEGAFDDSIRHAVTKLAHLHFAAAEPYRQRIIQMGERPDRVFTVGAPALDNMRDLEVLERNVLEADLGRRLPAPLLLATYHPATRGDIEPSVGVSALTGALGRFPNASVVFTGVNSDPGHSSVEDGIRAFVAAHQRRVSLHASLGQQRYLSLMKLADVVVGNSSSGLIEAPALGTPTVNMGDRQQGRLRAPSVLDCAETEDAVAGAISEALARGPSTGIEDDNPLGDGFAARRMADVLSSANLDDLTAKSFHDLAPAIPASPSSVMIIAEAGVNHNGSVDLARQLIDAAAMAGADAVKFQTFKANALATRSAPKAGYQMETTGRDTTQHDMLKALELSDKDHFDLEAYCRERRLVFLSTPFDLGSLAFLVDRMGLQRIKIGSGDLTNAPLLLDTARRGCDAILSTGMASASEVERALAVLAFGYSTEETAPKRRSFERAFMSPQGQASLREKVVLLQCTTEYPAPATHLNLRAMDSLAAQFGLPVGFSDHSQGPEAAIAAVARGARIVEKHITLDCGMPGPDHAASMEPGAFAAMVAAIREVEAALGDGIKAPSSVERENRTAARKSLVTRTPIVRGEIFDERNLGVKRPGNGISALEFFDHLGEVSLRDYDEDEVLS